MIISNNRSKVPDDLYVLKTVRDYAIWFDFLIADSGVLDILSNLAPYCKAGSYWLREI